MQKGQPMTQVDEMAAGALTALETTTANAQAVQAALHAAFWGHQNADSGGDWAVFTQLFPDQALSHGLSHQTVTQFLEYAEAYQLAAVEAVLALPLDQIADHCVTTGWNTLIAHQAPEWARYDCSDELWPEFRKYFVDHAAWLDPHVGTIAEQHMAQLDAASWTDRYSYLVSLGLPVTQPAAAEWGEPDGTECFADIPEEELAALIDHLLDLTAV
ncbi:MULTISPECIES: hypothetical protein [Streptomyces]|nr:MULTISPECIES: hypothetical protein [Streptomyces]